MKKILFKLLALLVGRLLAKRFGYGRPYYPAHYDPYYRGGFFKPYKYKKKKSWRKKLLDWLD